jgi:hypothetical protein
MIFIAGLLFWSQSGFVFWQVARKVTYHFQHSRHLSKERDTLVLSNDDVSKLVWVKHDEIRYQGKMFDVKRRFVVNGRMVLTGHYDTHDDKLFSWLTRMFDDHEGSKHGKHKVGFWFCDALLPNTQLLVTFTPLTTPAFYSIQQKVINATLHIASPPPRHC